MCLLDAVPERWKPEGSFQGQRWSEATNGHKKTLTVCKVEMEYYLKCQLLTIGYSQVVLANPEKSFILKDGRMNLM